MSNQRSPSQLQRKRNAPAIVLGIILIVVGAVTLAHPSFSYAVSSHRANVESLNVLFETRRIIHFPLWFSIPVLTIGAAITIAAMRKA